VRRGVRFVVSLTLGRGARFAAPESVAWGEVCCA